MGVVMFQSEGANSFTTPRVIWLAIVDFLPADVSADISACLETRYSAILVERLKKFRERTMRRNPSVN